MSGFDSSEVRRFAADLRQLPSVARRDVRAVLEKGANNIKNQLRAEMLGSTHFGQIAPAISYDILERAGGVEAEIGPVKGSPGSLANIAYFGTSRGGGTVADPEGALTAEVPSVVRHIEEVISRWLL